METDQDPVVWAREPDGVSVIAPATPRPDLRLDGDLEEARGADSDGVSAVGMDICRDIHPMPLMDVRNLPRPARNRKRNISKTR